MRKDRTQKRQVAVHLIFQSKKATDGKKKASNMFIKKGILVFLNIFYIPEKNQKFSLTTEEYSKNSVMNHSKMNHQYYKMDIM